VGHDRDRKTWNPSTKTVSPIAPYHSAKYFRIKARGKRAKIILRSNRPTDDQLGQANMPRKTEKKREKEREKERERYPGENEAK